MWSDIEATNFYPKLLSEILKSTLIYYQRKSLEMQDKLTTPQYLLSSEHILNSEKALIFNFIPSKDVDLIIR